MKKQQNSEFHKLLNRCNNFIYFLIEKVIQNNSKFIKFANSNPYARLMRLHQPIGIQLLLMPVLWTLVIVSKNIFHFLYLCIIFVSGAIAIRGAGVIINDIVDKDFDKEVKRTKVRPIASGELSVIQAIKFLFVLLTISLGILLLLPVKSIYFGVLAVMLTTVYPFIKRYSNLPQVFLGFTFNLGVFVAWFAVKEYFSFVPILIYLSAVLWTIGYDIIYASQDKEYDKKIGIKSMTLILKHKSKQVLRYLYIISISMISIAGLNANLNFLFFIFVSLGLWYSHQQINTINLNSPHSCKGKFESNFEYGLIILVGFVLGRI